MHTMGIYEIRNIENDMVYIGSSCELRTRWRDHRNRLIKNIHCNNYLQHAWNKYGKNSFKFNVLEVVKNRDDLLAIEQRWLDKTKCYEQDIGYNIARFTDANLRRLEDEDILLIAKLYKDGIYYKEIADIVGVSIATIHAIKNGSMYRDITKLPITNYRANKLEEYEVLEIVEIHKEMTEDNMLTIDIANKLSVEYDISTDTIFDIISGKTWGNITGIKYVPKRTNMTKDDIKQLYSELKQGIDKAVLADKYNVSVRYIGRIELGEMWSSVTGIKYKRHILEVEEVKEIYNRSNNGEKTKVLAEKFNVSTATILRIKNRKIWKQVTALL